MDETGEHHLKQSYPGSQGQKSHFLPHMQIRDQTNAVILLDTGHTKGRPCMGGTGKGKET
jgi:hypothetical protein